MEPNDNNNTNTNNTNTTNNLSSYFHHFNHQPPPPPPPPTNGVVVTPTSGDGSHSHMLYPHTTTTSTVVPSAVSSQSQLQKKKRGRPRKYSSPEEALAARKAATTSSSLSPSFSSSSRKSSQSFSLGTAGQDFTPHFITVLAGEDVGQKIMSFMQQHKCEICILSASGFISNASLSQPATSGGSITYEGRFEIVSLNGSYIRNEVGSRSGGLSVCLSNTDGQIIGGGVGGPLKAAGPVQVIVGAFIVDPKKDASAGIKGDVSSSKLPPPVSDPVSSFGFSRPIDSSTGNPIRGTEEHQTIGGSHFNIQQGGMQGTHSRPSDWGGHPDSRNADFELTGRAGQGAHQSSDENGYYD